MKKFPFNQLKSLAQPINFPGFISRTVNNLWTNCNTASISDKIKAASNNKTTIKNDVNVFGNLIPKNYSFFSNSRTFPIKCKIKTNECGQKIAEPYIAKKPSCINIPPLSKDFTMNPEERCVKLQEKMVTYSPPHPGRMRSRPQTCSESDYACPNALTKYLRSKGRCQEVWRGVENNDCKKKDSCGKVKKATYTGRDCALNDPCKTKTDTTRPQTTRQKTKKLLEDMASKLKMRLMKPSGFLSEDFIREVCWRLRTRKGSKELLTYVKEASNGEKSTDKFGVQILRKRNQSAGKFLEEFEVDKSSNSRGVEVFLSERKRLLDSLSKESSNPILLEGMIKAAKSRRTEDDETVTKPEDEVMRKTTKKKIPKPKSKSGIRRRRRRTRWFSKIPIEPNMKGSVIFANGTAQDLEDPCKILSVNFSASNLHQTEDQKEFAPDQRRCNSSVEQMMENYDYVVEKLTPSVVIHKDESEEICLKDEESEYYFDENLCIQRSPPRTTEDQAVRPKHLNHETDREDIEQRSEPIVRQKKISKLDKTVKCFTTTVLPEIQQHKKRLKKVKKHSKSGLKPGSTDNLNTSLLDLNNYPSTGSSDAFGKAYHAMTTNNLLLNFKKDDFKDARRKDVTLVMSDSSFVKIKDISPIYESGDEIDGPKVMSKNGVRRDLQLQPGVTRPVTQKAAHLNLLDSKALTPVSSAWKKIPGSPGRTKDKCGRKKVMTVSSKPDTLEIKGVNYQQSRLKSTVKSALSWKSRCEVEKKPCPTQKKNYDEKADSMYPLPADWDYDGAVPEEMARKWNTWDCPKEKDVGCPITSEDLKKGPPGKKPVSAAALNRCNLEECKNRLRCRKPASRCRNTSLTNKPVGPGK